MTSNPIILITGANTGLGFETVKALCQSPKVYTILLGGRNLDKATAAVQKAQAEFPKSPSSLTPVQIDIEDDDSISRLFEHVSTKYSQVDVLINNAGAQFEAQFYEGKVTMRELWNKSWDVNVSGAQIMTHTFIPLLLKSSDPRLLFIASGTAALSETDLQALYINKSPAKGWPKEGNFLPAYRSSKTGMNMMMREWVRILKEDGVKVWCVSPGFLATGLGGDQERNKKAGAIDPTVGANLVRSVVEGARDQDVGKVVRKDTIQPW